MTDLFIPRQRSLSSAAAICSALYGHGGDKPGGRRRERMLSPGGPTMMARIG